MVIGLKSLVNFVSVRVKTGDLIVSGRDMFKEERLERTIVHAPDHSGLSVGCWLGHGKEPSR